MANLGQGRKKTPKTDWRSIIASEMYDPVKIVKATTFDTGYELIQTAAYNRRMEVTEYIGRAALAFAVYDADGDPTWEEVTKKEPPLADIRVLNKGSKVLRNRMRGHGYGKWQIERLSDG